MVESPRWRAATERAGQAARAAITLSGVRDLFRGRYLGSVLMLIGMYGIWNLMAGTNGFYLPHILRTVGSESQATSVGIQCISFVLSGLGVALVFMTRVDRANHRLMLGVSATLQAVGMFLFVIFPVALPVAIGYVVLTGFLVVSGIIGIVFAPAHTAGRSLEEIHPPQEARGPA